MIPGSPFLSTWTADGSLRLYQFSANQFVPLGVAGGLLHDTALSPPTATLGWTGDVAHIIRRQPDRVWLEAFDSLGSPVGSTDFGAMITQYRAAVARNIGQFTAWGDGDSAGILYSDGAYFDMYPARTLPAGRTSKTAFGYSPDGRLAVTSYVSGGNNVLNALPAAQASPPYGYADGATKSLGVYAPDIIQVSPDNRHVMLGKIGDIEVRVLSVNAAVDTIGDLPAIALTKPLRALSVAPYGRFVAISTLDAGSYETKIYRRVGDFYQELQTIAGLGNLLTFTADGEIIVDANRRLAYRWNAVTRLFEVIPNALNSVTIGAVSQALSLHVPQVKTTARFYQAGLMRHALQDINTANLKLTLLTFSAPPFDPTHSTIAQVMGAAEVTDGNWPIGGVTLQNFAAVPTGSTMASWSFDDVEHRVVGGAPMTFRHAFIYDASLPTPTPFMRIDFAEDIIVAPDNVLDMVFSDGKLVTFTY